MTTTGPEPMTVPEIDGVTGFRDVGGIPADGGVIRTGRLFRSGHLAGLGAQGADAVRARVRRIVDLRADDEVAADATPLTGVEITRLPLYLGSARSFFLEDYSLGEIYAHLLSGGSNRLVDAVRIIAEGEPTLVHCTAGKDRTGVTIALALAAVGADREAVVADYASTGDLIPAEHRKATSERLAKKYPQSSHAWMLATESPAEVMRETLANLDAEWGSAAGYLIAHGLSTQELSALRSALVEPEPTLPGVSS
ncbi:tyrosine-protein phosphatase [Microbacterium aurantiacum]|uniref:tyrosine-protein phosphatase n=1 Tax=Microbacterium aurantiacum TaxID=162393 RepID=UPI001FE83C3B|nr:tyrosine-protein phosphatase [Microbacterium aurantiacum]